MNYLLDEYKAYKGKDLHTHKDDDVINIILDGVIKYI